jgi:type IV pilus assembly protein PilX
MMSRSLPALIQTYRQRGISLIIVLILLIASVFLGASAAVIALQAEKASRGDRDRQVAFEAAEAALVDAEQDIDGAPSSGGVNKRSTPFSPTRSIGFPSADQSNSCIGISDPQSAGLCRRQASGVTPTWLAADLSSTSGAGAVSVPYGFFTGQKFPVQGSTGGGSALPLKLPRYLIELMPYNLPGQTAQIPNFSYRITAIGFGSNKSTQVVLQAFYRKEE